MTFEEFKRARAKAKELRQEIPAVYNDMLEHYEHFKIWQLKNNSRLEYLYYELEGVKGVDYTKQKSTYNNDARIEKYHNISEQIAELEKENEIVGNCIKAFEYVRDSVKDTALKTKITECYFKPII